LALSVDDPPRERTKPVIALTTHEMTTRKILSFMERRSLRNDSLEYGGQSSASARAFD
jgi:hypothetical protein